MASGNSTGREFEEGKWKTGNGKRKELYSFNRKFATIGHKLAD